MLKKLIWSNILKKVSFIYLWFITEDCMLNKDLKTIEQYNGTTMCFLDIGNLISSKFLSLRHDIWYVIQDNPETTWFMVRKLDHIKVLRSIGFASNDPIFSEKHFKNRKYKWIVMWFRGSRLLNKLNYFKRDYTLCLYGSQQRTWHSINNAQ